MTRGVALKDCDWGGDFFATFLDDKTFPILKIAHLGKLACLRASYSFQKKENLAGIADLAAAVKMARHIGKRGPLMATVIQFAIEHSAIDVAAAYLPQQNARTRKALAACLEPLPKSSVLSAAMQGEKEFVLQYVRPQYQNKSSKEAFECLRKDEFFAGAEVTAIVKASRGDVKGLLELIDGKARLYEELASVLVLPSAGFKPALSALQKRCAEQNPLAASILPSAEGIRYASDLLEVRYTMLHAAVEVVSGGVEKLKAIKDPFGDGPFDYRSFSGGFELRSKLQGKGGGRAALVRVGLI
jgi:hypothetical protein